MGDHGDGRDGASTGPLGLLPDLLPGNRAAVATGSFVHTTSPRRLPCGLWPQRRCPRDRRDIWTPGTRHEVLALFAVVMSRGALTLLSALSAVSGAYVQGPCAPAAASSSSCRRRAQAPPLLKAAHALRVAHCVDDVDATAAFYKGCLGLEVSQELADGAGVVLATCAAAGDELRLELRKVAGAKFVEAPGYQHREGAGYQGLMARVPSVADAVAAATSSGGTVLRAAETIVHGPALAPVDEVDTTENPLVEALVADPSGYPLLLHECTGATPALSGCRVGVYEWKASQEWYESQLGWQTVRWNSNVHREASLTITMGPRAASPMATPRGYDAGQGESAAVVQLMYIYGCPPKTQPEVGGLAELVLARAEGEAEAEGESQSLSDPDAYKITIAA